MKICFLGGKAIGYGILQYLLVTDDVVAVYTNPSDLEAYKKPTWFPSIKELVSDSIYTTENINTHPPKVDFDWIVCAYYDRIVKEHVLKLPLKGALNVHMGIAERYRGCYPTTYPIINNDIWAGITIHKMTTGTDDGPIYIHGVVSVDPSDTGKSLYYKCTGAGVSTFQQWWPFIKDGLTPEPQEVHEPIYHTRQQFPSLDLTDLTPEEAERHGRALTFPPFPRPYYRVNDKKIPIYYD